MRPGRANPAARVAAVRRYLRWMRHEVGRFDELERLRARFPDARIQDGVHIVGPERLELEPEAVIQTGCHLHCGGKDWTDGGGFIRIARRAVIGPHCVLWGGGGLTIGAGATVGPGVMMFSTQERFEVRPEEPARTHTLTSVTIGEEAWVGSQAIVVPGGGMEPRSVLAAQSLLRAKVPTGKMYGGVPASELRDVRGQFRRTLDE